MRYHNPAIPILARTISDPERDLDRPERVKSLPEVPGEEIHRPLLRQIVVGLAVATALIAAEAVLGALVHIHLDLWLSGADRVHIRHRDRGILLAEMHLHRAVGAFALGAGDTAAIPAG
jgi:hypothetical protein